MPDLPKSVVERMKAQAAPEPHPDADLLAAFAEQTLTGRERERVLAHLAACAACRETVSLASPPPAAVQPGGVFVPWYRRPQIFAWAGTLATLALVGALILNYTQSRTSNLMVSDAVPQKVATTQPAENKPAATPPQSPASRSEGGAKRAEPARRDILAKGEREQQKGKAAGEEHAQSALGTAQPMQAPSKDEKKLDGGVLADQYVVMKEAAPAPAPATKAANVMIEKPQAAAEAVTVESAAAAHPKSADLAVSGGTAGALSQARAAKMAAAPTPRWTVTEKGRLQRSFDSGHTWQLQLAGETTAFRAVAVVGNHVWAGGTAAALFHSADGGEHWTKQTLPGTSADVVSLQFSDSHHGSAKTADGAAWATADAGQHWTRQ